MAGPDTTVFDRVSLSERNWLLPSTRLLHWAKRGFEWNYLRQSET